MALSARQIKKELNRIVEEKLKTGFIPTVDYVRSELNKFYRRNIVGKPTFKGRKQPYRRVWDVDFYNNNLDEIYNDLNNLYEEIVSQFTINLENFDYNDVERKRLLYEINKLDGEISDLLILAEGVEGYLYAVHDDFLDRSKIDLSRTSCEINTSAGIVTLRESKNGIKKIDLSHYFDVEQYPVLSERKFADNIVSNNLVFGSKFGYAFSDINSAWNQLITTKEPGPLEVFFIIEIDPHNQGVNAMSRIEVLGHSSKVVEVEPLWSIDNVNFRALPIHSSMRIKNVYSGRTKVWNFPEMFFKYLKFVVKFHEEDESVGGSDDPRYLYNLGFKNISIFETAYTPESKLYSKAFEIKDYVGEPTTIDKVSLETDQDVPEGTSLRHFISLEDADDVDRYNWVEISPINDPHPTESQIIDFRHVAFLKDMPLLRWDESSYDFPVKNKNGISFYQIYEFPYEPVRDSVKIYRGYGDWQVIPKYRIERRTRYDEGHTFDGGNTGTEFVELLFPVEEPIEGEGLIRGSVKVKSTSGSSPDVVYTTPNDYIVDHTSKKIFRPKDSLIRSDGATVYVDYQYDLEIQQPTVYRTYIYILNPDGISINIAPFTSREIELGQFLAITTNGERTDISREVNYHIPPGWHKVETTAAPEGPNDRFYGVNGKHLRQMVHKMFAYGETLQEVSYFELIDRVRKDDRSKYAIYDYDGDGNKEIIVNYRPQTEEYKTIGKTYGHNYDLLNPSSQPEVYELSYKYIATFTNNLYYLAEFSRKEDASPDLTPTLSKYTIRVGY